MADTTITVTFTEAQWARVVAASNYVKGNWEVSPISSTIDADYLSTHWKNEISTIVKNYEKSQASVDDF